MYQTVSADNQTLKIKIDELGSAGTDLNENTKFFLALPLDLSAVVSNTYTNFTDEFDKRYVVPLTVNRLSFAIHINSSPAFDVDADHPVIMELAFYE